MSTSDTQQIVNRAWNFAHVLRDDSLSYMAYTEQVTFLLFLKMADEQAEPPYNKPPIVPAKFSWQSLLKQAFEGKLVPQGPTDEPAGVLLERLRVTRSVHEGNGKVAITAGTHGRRAKSKQMNGRADE